MNATRKTALPFCEYVPLTALRLNPIPRVRPERIDTGTAITPRTLRFQARTPAYYAGPPTHRSELVDSWQQQQMYSYTGMNTQRSLQDFPTAVQATRGGEWCNSSTQCQTSTATIQNPFLPSQQQQQQQQMFLDTHMMSSPLPEELTVNEGIQLFSWGPGKKKNFKVMPSSMLRHADYKERQKKNGGKTCKKTQIKYSNEPKVSSDPPGNLAESFAVAEMIGNFNLQAVAPIPLAVYTPEGLTTENAGNSDLNQTPELFNEQIALPAQMEGNKSKGTRIFLLKLKIRIISA